MTSRSLSGVRTPGYWLALCLLLLTLAGCARRSAESTPYHCPMHPTFVTQGPASCPICGMDVVPIPPPAPEVSAESHGGTTSRPTSRPTSGPTSRPTRRPTSRPAADRATGASPDHAAITLDAGALEKAGVRLAVARSGHLERSVRAVGRVVADETRVHTVTLKSGGWIETLHVNALGQSVSRGAPLLELYAPELVAAQQEFVTALDARDRFRDSALEEVRNGGEDLVSAARRRLEAFDVPATLVARLERDRQPLRTVSLPSPYGGVVTAREVAAGARVEAGQPILTLTDLSQVWVEADLHEFEAATVSRLQPVRITLAADPGAPIEARVDFVYPWLDGETRTLRIRSVVVNPGQRLKPGMFAEVALSLESAAGVRIPDEAVMDTGERRIVFVQTAPGRFEPRTVVEALRSGGVALIVAGLSDGETVAAAANFLLDSESRLRSALGAAGHDHGAAGGGQQ